MYSNYVSLTRLNILTVFAQVIKKLVNISSKVAFLLKLEIEYTIPQKINLRGLGGKVNTL